MTAQEFAAAISRLQDLLPNGSPIFDSEMIADWFEYFSDLPLDCFRNACRQVVRSETRFPAIATLLKHCGKANGPENDHGMATEIAERIWTALGRFGSTDPEGAQKYVGEIGWAAIGVSGRWDSLCEFTMENDKHSFIAQTRDLCVSLIRKQRAGIPLNAPPALPGANPALDQAIALMEGKEP